MSTKIHEGYRLAPGTDIWEFTERLRAQGNELRNKLDMEAIETFAQAAENERGEFPSREARLMAGYHGWADLMRTLGESRISDPHQLSVTFIRDPKNGRILARLYAGSKMEEVFTKQPEVEYFGYWDNSDPDEDCTEDEWRERKDSWERSVKMEAPIRHGISFDLRADSTDGIIEMIYGMGLTTS